MEKDLIYVTDDDPGIRELVAEYLQGQGYAVATAEDAKSLDALLAQGLPQLLVLDWMMPGEDGLSVARRLRAQPGFPPIIMLSARGEDIDRIIGLEVGADDYLPKPFNPRELLARIRAVMRRHAGGPAVAEPLVIHAIGNATERRDRVAALLKRVGLDDPQLLPAERFAQAPGQTGVHLDREDPQAAREERPRQGALPRPDLHDPAPGGRSERVDDPARGSRAREEILAEAGPP